MGFLRDLVVRIKGDKTQLDSTLKGAGQSVNSFGSIVTKLGATLAAAFGVGAIINFTKEAMKLAATAEGIKKGFDQIASPGLLKELRAATKGTVADMQLMSRAVQASNFQIPLKDLAKLLEFASARAIQTGQSVDYLVDSIVMGIGRKSPLILDNLGISAVRLSQLLKGPGVEMASVGDIAKAVGAIATEEMAKMGGMAETTGSKFQTMAASIDNLKVSWGNFANNSKIIKEVVQWLSDELTIFSDKRLSFWEKIFGTPNEYEKYLADIEEVRKTFGIGSDFKDAKKYSPAWAGDTGEANVKKTDTTEITKAGMGNIKMPGFGGKGKLAGGPGAGDQSMADAMAAQVDLDVAMSEAEAKAADMMKSLNAILRSGKDMAIDLAVELAEGLGEALSGGNIQDIGKGLLTSFANFLSQFGKMLVAFGIAQSAFYTALTTPGPHSAAIAIGAGMAMIIAAGAIKGAMANGGGALGGSSSGGGGYSSQGSGTQTIKITGVLKGKDIYLSGESYGNMLNIHT